MSHKITSTYVIKQINIFYIQTEYWLAQEIEYFWNNRQRIFLDSQLVEKHVYSDANILKSKIENCERFNLLKSFKNCRTILGDSVTCAFTASRGGDKYIASYLTISLYQKNKKLKPYTQTAWRSWKYELKFLFKPSIIIST